MTTHDIHSEDPMEMIWAVREKIYEENKLKTLEQRLEQLRQTSEKFQQEREQYRSQKTSLLQKQES